MPRRKELTAEDILRLFSILSPDERQLLDARLLRHYESQLRPQIESQLWDAFHARQHQDWEFFERTAGKYSRVVEKAVALNQEIIGMLEAKGEEVATLRKRLAATIREERKLRKGLRKPDPEVARETERIKVLRAAGKTWKEVGQELGIEPSTARSRCYRLRLRQRPRQRPPS